MDAPDARAVGKAIDTLYGGIREAETTPSALRAVLERLRPDETVMAGLLLRALPARFLELVASHPPWSRNPLLLGRVVLNPGVEQALSLRLIPSLYWRDLAVVAGTPRVPAPVRQSAEAALRDRLINLRPGERMALARLATVPILALLLADGDARVLEACLSNPRLRMEQVETAVRQATAPRALLEKVASSSRWGGIYGIRLALVLQARTPLHTSLRQITSLERRDLLRVASAKDLPPLVRASARAVLEGSGG